MCVVLANISYPCSLDYDIMHPPTQQRLLNLLERLIDQETGISRNLLPSDIDELILHVSKGDTTFVPACLTTSQVRRILHPMSVNMWRKNEKKLLELATIGARIGSPIPMLASGLRIQNPMEPVANLYNSIQHGFQLIPVSPLTTKDWIAALNSMQRALYEEFKNNYNIYHNVDRVQDPPLISTQGAGTERHQHTRKKQHKTRHKQDKRDP